jgi:hypothetical protein
LNAIQQDAAVVQQGGSVSVGGGNGATSFSGNLTVVATFVAAITDAIEDSSEPFHNKGNDVK